MRASRASSSSLRLISASRLAPWGSLPSSFSACASRRSATERRSQPHSMRSANTRSSDEGRRFQIASPTPAASSDSTIPMRSERTSMTTLLAGTSRDTSTAGSTTTKQVAMTAWGSHRSVRGARRVLATRTAIRPPSGNTGQNLIAGHSTDGKLTTCQIYVWGSVSSRRAARSPPRARAASSRRCAGRAASRADRAARPPTTAGPHRARRELGGDLARHEADLLAARVDGDRVRRRARCPGRAAAPAARPGASASARAPPPGDARPPSPPTCSPRSTSSGASRPRNDPVSGSTSW